MSKQSETDQELAIKTLEEAITKIRNNEIRCTGLTCNSGLPSYASYMDNSGVMNYVPGCISFTEMTFSFEQVIKNEPEPEPSESFAYTTDWGSE